MVYRKLKIFQHFLKKITPNSKEENLIVAGWPASGSTFIYQILKGIGQHPIKDHGYYNGKFKLQFFTIRDPRDIITSNARRVSSKIINSHGIEKALCNELDRFMNDEYQYINSYYKAQKCQKTIILKYEDFFIGKEVYLVNLLLNKLTLKMTQTEILNMIECHSIENNKKTANKLQDFKYWDEYTYIHGNHITNNGLSSAWKHHFTKNFANICNMNIGRLLIELGYEKDNNWSI